MYPFNVCVQKASESSYGMQKLYSITIVRDASNQLDHVRMRFSFFINSSSESKSFLSEGGAFSAEKQKDKTFPRLLHWKHFHHSLFVIRVSFCKRTRTHPRMLNRGIAAVSYFSSLARFASFTILYKKADARCLAYEIMLNSIESVESGR